MDADESKGKLGSGSGRQAIAAATNPHAFIGVHRRPSAVDLPFRIPGATAMKAP
jgi:hypothetical protein